MVGKGDFFFDNFPVLEVKELGKKEKIYCPRNCSDITKIEQNPFGAALAFNFEVSFETIGGGGAFARVFCFGCLALVDLRSIEFEISSSFSFFAVEDHNL